MPTQRCSASPTRLLYRFLSLAAFAAIAAFAATPGRAHAQQGPGERYLDLVFESVKRENDIVYGSAIDKPSGRPVDLRLDIYAPEGDTLAERPVFVFFFGGGFVAGDRKLEPQFYCNLMARRGYVAIAADYRINQGNLVTDGIPAAVSDARQVLRWIQEQADARGLDAERLVFGGSSAGAITALFATYTDLEAEPDVDAAEPALVLDLWGGLYTYIGQMETGEAPLAIFHGTEDRVVPYSEALALRDRAEAVDIRYLFTPLVGEAHAPFMPEEILTIFSGFAYDVLDLDAAAAPAPSETPEPSPEPSSTPEPPTPTAPPVAPSATPAAPTVTPEAPVQAGLVYMPYLRAERP